MGKPTGFIEIQRKKMPTRPVAERLKDWNEVYLPYPHAELQNQGARCMDCGIPFCHQGCPLGNLIPDWNDLVYHDRWPEAIKALHATNNFPEFTGRICPAPCEAACVLDINDDPVTIKQIEQSIADRAFEEGWVVPRPPNVRTGRSVAVVGSGPAGLAAAEEGIEFVTGVEVGRDVDAAELRERFDAVVIATGSTVPRDLPVPGRELDGIHFAMEYLEQRNRYVAGDEPPIQPISAAGKHVVIIGGGDTGADCLGNSHREKPASITQFELLPEPPPERPDDITPWPRWPLILRTSGAHEEGGERRYSVMTTHFAGEDGRVKELHGHEVGGPPSFDKIEGSEFTIPADLVLLAMGFLHTEHEGLVEQLGVTLDQRGNIVDSDWQT